MVNDTINHSHLRSNIPGSGFDSGLRLSSFDLGMSRADENFSPNIFLPIYYLSLLSVFGLFMPGFDV